MLKARLRLNPGRYAIGAIFGIAPRLSRQPSRQRRRAMPSKICAEGGWAGAVLVRHRCVVALACLVLLSGSAAHAQERTGGISGRVTDSRGEPQRLQVYLLTSGDIPAEDTYTGSNGVFAFSGLPGGVYYVIVEAAGFRPFRETVRLDLRVSPAVQVNITLEPLEKERQETSPIISNAPQSHKFNAKRPGDEFNPKALQEFNQANAKQQRGDVKGAIAHYQKAIRIAPDFYPALNNLGIVFLRQHNFADARTYFEKSLSVNPDDGEAYINLGHLLYEEGRYREAIERLKEGLQRGQSPAGHFLLGSAYLKLGHFDEAEQNLKRACSLDPAGMAAAHLQLANLYLMQHNVEEAKTELETYLHAHPSDPQAPAIRKMLVGIAARPIN